MPEEAKINFYHIKKCGYYKHGGTDALFGNIANIMAQLKDWATQPGLVLASTCAVSAPENCEDFLRTFCFDVCKKNRTGDFFLTTWNETPANQGKVPSVTASQPVGSAQVH